MKKTITAVLLSTLMVGNAVSAETNTNITEAPGRGKLPLLSPYRHTLPGSQSTLARWVFAKGAIVPLHHQPHEQVTWIVSGAVEVFSQGKRYTVRAGEVIIFPPNVPHEFHALEEGTVNVDFFTPPRQDWIDGNGSYNKLK